MKRMIRRLCDVESFMTDEERKIGFFAEYCINEVWALYFGKDDGMRNKSL